MPGNTPIDIAKASIEAYNAKDWQRVKETIAPQVIYDEVASHRRVTGASDVITAWQGWAKALPDSKAQFTRATAEGNTVTLELTWRGTHSGPLQTPNGEIAPTGKKIEVQAVQVVDVADGKATNIRHFFDMGTILQQIGVAD
jgi:steroid delta-isomerase-like uncharacterized protein